MDGHLEIVQEGSTRAIPLDQIHSIRCRYFPTRFQTHRYEMILSISTGERIKIANQYFKGVAQFKDRSESYREFVESLHRARAEVEPPCRYRAGASPASFWGSAIFLGIVLVGLMFTIVAFFTSIPTVAIVKLVVVIAMVPIALNWFRKNQPKEYHGDRIPPEILPS